MKQPSASLISFLGWYGTFILPAHIYDGTDWTTNPANQNPVGSGPFKFNNYAPGATIEFDANLDYWGEGPFVDRLVFSIQPDSNTAMQSLLNGETDVLTTPPARSQISTLEQTRRHYRHGPPDSELLLRANEREPRVHEQSRGPAWDFARDQPPAVCRCRAQRVQRCRDHVLSNRDPVGCETNPDAAVPQYDPAAAEAALDKAGYPRNGGTRFKLVYLHFTLGSEYADMAAIIKQNLEDVGIECEIVALEIGAFSERALAGDFDLNMISGLWGPDPENLKIRVGTGGAVNTSFYSNPTVDQLLDEGSTITDTEERARNTGRFSESWRRTYRSALSARSSSSTRTPIAFTAYHSTRESARSGSTASRSRRSRIR